MAMPWRVVSAAHDERFTKTFPESVMSSILTNSGAISALQALRSISGSMQETQRQVATGLRVGEASDNAAYWSISTTMRSDNMAISAVEDALGLGAAKVDTAYAGISSVTDLLTEFRAKLVAAREEGVDKAKIQDELFQLQQQVRGVARSSSFSGENWLDTDIADIHDKTLDIERIVSSFVRDASGSVSVKTADFHLSEVSLFNSTGGGLLEKDNRKSLTIGGIRNYDSYMDSDGVNWIDRENTVAGPIAAFEFDFTGPMTFASNADRIVFDVLVDKDNPAEVPPPHHPGQPTLQVEITRAMVLAALPGSNGVISTYHNYITVLGQALAGTGASAGYIYTSDANGNTIPMEDRIRIRSQESSGLDGAYVEISGLDAGTVAGGSGGLANDSDFGGRGQDMILSFDPFIVHLDGDEEDGVEIRFNYSVNGAPATSHAFNRTYVNELFDRDTGKVETAEEMVTLLQSLIGTDWPDVIIEATGPGTISMRSDNNVDRLSGTKTYAGFTGIDVSIEPLSQLDFMEIDIEQNPDMGGIYLGYVSTVLEKVISGAASLGALQTRIDMQAEFASRLSASIDTGVGRLVDADMNEGSTRLKALQTQEQLALQSLSIANANAENLLTLFR